MTQPVVSARAEAASALLFHTLGAHRVTVAAMRTRRASRLAMAAPLDAEQIQCQATLVRLLSITESFTVMPLAEIPQGCSSNFPTLVAVSA